MRKGQGKAIGKGKGRRSLPIGTGEHHAVAVQFFNSEAKPYQLLTALTFQFPFVQQVGNGELERQAEAGFQKGAAFEIDKNGGIGDQNLHPAQSRAAASEAGGSSIRRFRS